MKLLLTSSGITNPSIAKALLDLVGKPFHQCSMAFIPTAANWYRGDKRWFIEDLKIAENLGFASIDVVDISALPKEGWLPGFQNADVFFFEGGNTNHLMYWIERSGLRELLPDLLRTKVYIGVSAGSIVAGPRLDTDMSDRLYGEDVGPYTNDEGLGLVDFLIRAHVGSPSFPGMTFDALDRLAKERTESFYAIDHHTAIKVVDDRVEIVSEGEWRKYH